MKKFINEHRPSKKEIYNFTDEKFGYYLAGLIDGDGHISTQGQIIIVWNKLDTSAAYKLKTRLGFGKVSIIENKNAVNLIVSNKLGAIKVSELIRNKLKHPAKIKQFNERLSTKYFIPETSQETNIEWDTPWLAGFIDADGYLYIKIVRNKEVRLSVKIDQKQDILLTQIMKKFGGHCYLRSSTNTYYYSSTSYEGIYKYIKYLDEYSLQNNRNYLRYHYLRKAYIMIQKDLHLTELGLEKIINYKKLLEIKI